MNLKSLALPLLLLATTAVQAQQDHHDKFASVDIHTNAVCDMCQHTIETEMLYEKGVQAVKVDLASNTIHIDYKARKTNPDKLRHAVAKLGYMADNLMPDPKARKALPSCCQGGSCDMPGAKKAGAASSPEPPAPKH